MDKLEIVFQGRKFRVGRQVLTLADGRSHTLEVVQHPGSVVILPWVDERRICLIRNDRWAVGKTLYELPAGTLSPEEDPLEAARRELQEETGYVAGRLTKLLEFYTSPGFLTERMYLFLAENLHPGPPRLEPGERITPELVDWDQVLDMIDHGQIEDAKTLVALLYYERRRT